MTKSTHNRIRSCPLAAATLLLLITGGARAEGVDLEALARKLQQGDIASQAANGAGPPDNRTADATGLPVVTDPETPPSEHGWRFPENGRELAGYARSILADRARDPDERRRQMCQLVAELQSDYPDTTPLDLTPCRDPAREAG